MNISKNTTAPVNHPVQPTAKSNTPPEQATPKKVIQSNTSSAPKDQVKASLTPQGQSLPKVSLNGTAQLTPSAQAAQYLENLQPYLNQKDSPTLRLPEKEAVLKILESAAKDGLLPTLAEKLDQQGQLLELYHNMGSLVNRDPGASTFLSIFTLGLTMGNEVKNNRANEMRELLKQHGVNPNLLDKLK